MATGWMPLSAPSGQPSQGICAMVGGLALQQLKLAQALVGLLDWSSTLRPQHKGIIAATG
jgi:hypothetical protein